jgi:hypothetical protein
VTPLDPQAAAAAEDAYREALRARLVAAEGNVSQVTRDLAAANGEPLTPRVLARYRRTLDEHIGALGLREWLRREYPSWRRT